MIAGASGLKYEEWTSYSERGGWIVRVNLLPELPHEPAVHYDCLLFARVEADSMVRIQAPIGIKAIVLVLCEPNDPGVYVLPLVRVQHVSKAPEVN